VSPAAHMQARSYFEDVTVGSQHETPGLTVTEAHVVLYANLTRDDPPAAGVAPELLGLCLSTGLGWRIDRPPLVVLAFMGFEWKILRPLRVGDTIRSIARTAVKRAMRDGGVVIEEHAIVDQRGDTLQHGRFTFLVAKRPAA
jgi:3-hydroxybutyryl-CoA dehydratase